MGLLIVNLISAIVVVRHVENQHYAHNLFKYGSILTVGLFVLLAPAGYIAEKSVLSMNETVKKAKKA
jgi:hypothetical protein